MARVNVYLPDDLAARAKARELPISQLAQHAIQRELEQMTVVQELPRLKGILDGLAPIVVETGASGVEVEFTGAWIVDPIEALGYPSHTHQGDVATVGERTYAVALTKRGRYAVYSQPASTNDYTNFKEPSELVVYESLPEVLAKLPNEVAKLVEARVTGRVILDI